MEVFFIQSCWWVWVGGLGKCTTETRRVQSNPCQRSRVLSALPSTHSLSGRCCEEGRIEVIGSHLEHAHLPLPTPLTGYALPTTGVSHVRISGEDRHRCCFGRLARRQCAAPAVPARAGWIALPARHARVAQFGVRQPCCRASRAHDPVRGPPLPILVTEVLMCSCRSSSWSGINELPARRCVVAPGSCLRTNGNDQPLPAVAMMPTRGLEARATGSAGSLS